MKNSKLTLRKFLSIALATLLLFSLFCVTGCTESTSKTTNTGLSSGVPLRDKTSDSTTVKTESTTTKTTTTSKPTISETPPAPSVTDTAPAPTVTETPSNSATKTTSSSKPSVSIPEEDDTEDSVWIPTNGGTKYHSKSTCSNMKNPEKVSLSTAIEEGFEACKRCH